MKKYLLTIIFLAITLNSFCQHNVMFSAGATLFSGKASVDLREPNASGFGTHRVTVEYKTSGFGITGYPRFNLIQGFTNSLSIGAPISLGFNGSANSQSGGSFTFTLDAPVALDFNFGQASSRDNSNHFGGFTGIGIDYYSSAANADLQETQTVNASGFLVHGGLKFMINQRSYGVRVSYTIGLDEVAYNIFGIGILYNFGIME